MVYFGLSRKELTYCEKRCGIKVMVGVLADVALWFHNNCLLTILYHTSSLDCFSHAVCIVQAARTSWHAVGASSLDTIDTVEQSYVLLLEKCILKAPVMQLF